MPTASPRMGIGGREWVRLANDRDIGSVEFREVSLQVGQGRALRRLEIRTLRRQSEGQALTVTCLHRPRPMRNINYVTREERGRIDPFDIQLYLPYVGGSLRDVEDSRRCEGLLGSDFSYDDMRTWLCEEGHDYERLADDGDGHVVLRGRCQRPEAHRASATAPFDVRIDPMTGFVRRITTWTGDGGAVAREYRAEDVTEIDGVLIAQRMTLENRLSGRSTQILLRRAWYDRVEIDPGIFDPARRGSTADYLERL